MVTMVGRSLLGHALGVKLEGGGDAAFVVVKLALTSNQRLGIRLVSVIVR
jgi:hypothetical protein